MKIPKINLHLNEVISGELDELEDYKDTHRVLCLCKLGMRSAAATQILRLQGYSAANIAGGIRDLEGVVPLHSKY